MFNNLKLVRAKNWLEPTIGCGKCHRLLIHNEQAKYFSFLIYAIALKRVELYNFDPNI